MNIHDAVSRAMDSGMYITLPEFYRKVKIKPMEKNCVVSRWDGSNPSKSGWQPSGYDLRREDWMVVPDVRMSEKRMMQTDENH